jgi:CopG family transcriptional regulator, nickel-responsive regulator
MYMRRLTVSIEDDLVQKFDAFAQSRGYENRSEAFRDLLRNAMGEDKIEAGAAKYCVASLSYVYNHHERRLASRLTELQHASHDVALATMHAHLDHDSCIESVILQGLTTTVVRFAESIIAEKGVRHGKINLVPVDLKTSYLKPRRHVHLHPKT